MCHHLCQFSFHIHIHINTKKTIQNHIVCSKRVAPIFNHIYTVGTQRKTEERRKNTKQYPLNTNRAKWERKKMKQQEFCHSCFAQLLLLLALFCMYIHIYTYVCMQYVCSTWHYFFLHLFFIFARWCQKHRFWLLLLFWIPTTTQIAFHITLVTPIDLISILHRLCVWVCIRVRYAMKHANRIWFANLWSFRLKTNNPFFIHIQNTRPNRCYCKR